MKKQKTFSLKKNWIFKWVFPGLLFLWVIFIAVQLNPEVPLSIILQNFSQSSYTHWTTKELLAHHFAQAEFTAGQDNLGIVAVRFNTYIRINSDSVIFRIKQKGQKNWFYTNTYKVDQFQPNQKFTFGFPIIPDSKEKTYIFQIESVKGVHKDAVALSPIEPVFSAKYQFTKSYFYHKPLAILKFVPDKLISMYTDFTTSFYFLAYLYVGLLSFVGYYLWLFLGIKFPYARIPLLIYLGFVVIDILVPTLPYRDVSLMLLSIAWIVLCFYYEYASNVSFTFALFWFGLAIVVKLAGFTVTAEYMSHWLYIFFTIGTLQLIFELFFPQQELLSAAEVWQKEIVAPYKKIFSRKK